jgi:hypothetical protein
MNSVVRGAADVRGRQFWLWVVGVPMLLGTAAYVVGCAFRYADVPSYEAMAVPLRMALEWSVIALLSTAAILRRNLAHREPRNIAVRNGVVVWIVVWAIVTALAEWIILAA